MQKRTEILENMNWFIACKRTFQCPSLCSEDGSILSQSNSHFSDDKTKPNKNIDG